jgi:hypothetical protein
MNRAKQLLVVVGMLFSSITFAGLPLTTSLTGAAEVPGPGDPDGSGTAKITINPGTGEVCWEIQVRDIAPAVAAHIHRGTADVAGPVVVPLSAPDANGFSSGCATADKELAVDIFRNSEAFYVNVHTADFPAGALRGQLPSRPGGNPRALN